MATATETYTWEAHGAALKAHLGISGTAEDTKLQAWLAGAAADCDDFCGPLPAAHSALVVLGIYAWVGAMRTCHDRLGSAGLASVSTGALSESYVREGVMVARSMAYPLWMGSVKNILGSAAG